MASSSLNNPSSSDSNADPWIPEGYVCVVGPDEKEYLLPEFMLPALQQDCEANKKKADLNVSRASGTVSDFLSRLGFIHMLPTCCVFGMLRSRYLTKFIIGN
jgi:hypothetical protein